jgi:hypothetical protein
MPWHALSFGATLRYSGLGLSVPLKNMVILGQGRYCRCLGRATAMERNKNVRALSFETAMQDNSLL